MKSIEIKTTQNVTLEYELADLRDRVIGYLVDLVIIGVALGLISVIGFSAFVGSETGSMVLVILLACIFIFYSFAMEVLNNGQSIGKMVMKIKVIKTTGGRATTSDYAARWVFRMIDIYFSLGGIASILIASSGKAQRIGDIVANTAVIRLTTKMDLSLSDLLSIQSRESYTPVYNEAKYLAEEDLLLIKSTLNRFVQYKNEQHREAVQMLAEQIRQVLGLPRNSSTDLEFLKTILKDYVVLTR
jgi:uncharacterized RDD family membrane protein YckC